MAPSSPSPSPPPFPARPISYSPNNNIVLRALPAHMFSNPRSPQRRRYLDRRPSPLSLSTNSITSKDLETLVIPTPPPRTHARNPSWNTPPLPAELSKYLSSSPQSNEPDVVTALTRLHKDELARRVLDTFVAEFARVQKKRTSLSPYASPKAILHSERFQKRIRDRAQKQANLISFESNIIFETGRVVIPPALGMA